MPDPQLETVGVSTMTHATNCSPADLILARCRAFGEKDFDLIYDSYHPDSYFRRQFPEQSVYLHHGRSNLGHDFAIESCRILREEQSRDTARIIFYLRTRYQGQTIESVELASLVYEAERWWYHSSQKSTLEEIGKPVENIDFDDFARIIDKVFF